MQTGFFSSSVHKYAWGWKNFISTSAATGFEPVSGKDDPVATYVGYASRDFVRHVGGFNVILVSNNSDFLIEKALTEGADSGVVIDASQESEIVDGVVNAVVNVFNCVKR